MDFYYTLFRSIIHHSKSCYRANPSHFKPIRIKIFNFAWYKSAENHHLYSNCCGIGRNVIFFKTHTREKDKYILETDVQEMIIEILVRIWDKKIRTLYLTTGYNKSNLDGLIAAYKISRTFESLYHMANRWVTITRWSIKILSILVLFLEFEKDGE